MAARGGNRQCREAVVMAGNAGGFGNEVSVGALDERNTSLDRPGDRVSLPGLEDHRLPVGCFGARLDQEIDYRRIAAKLGEIERGQPEIDLYFLSADPLALTSAPPLDQEFDDVHINQVREAAAYINGVRPRGSNAFTSAP